MSTAPSSTKRVTSEVASTLTNVAQAYVASFPYAKGIEAALLNPSLTEFLQGMKMAVYRANLAGECTHILPTVFKDYEVARDKVGRISSIYSDTEKIAGRSLRIIQALYAAELMGSQFTILEIRDNNIAGLVIPAGMLIDLAPVASQTAGKPNATVYTAKARTYSHLTNAEIVKLLQLPQVTLGQVPDLVRTYDRVKEVDNTLSLNKDLHSDLSHLRDLLNDADVKDRQRALFSKLLSLLVQGTSMEERIEEFVKCPSLEYAQCLRLTSHFQGELWHKGTSKKAGWRPYDDLAGVDIVMSTTPIDAKGYYNSANRESFRPIPWSDDLVVKHGRGEREVKSIYKLSGESYQKFLTAASESLGSKPAPSQSKDTVEDNDGDDSKKVVEIDF